MLVYRTLQYVPRTSRDVYRILIREGPDEVAGVRMAGEKQGTVS